jgi:hypothetical protein
MRAAILALACVACGSKPTVETPRSPFGVLTPMREFALRATCFGDFQHTPERIYYQLRCTEPSRPDLGWRVTATQGDDRIETVYLTATTQEGIRVLARRMIPNLVAVDDENTLFGTLRTQDTDEITILGIRIEVVAHTIGKAWYQLAWRPQLAY